MALRVSIEAEDDLNRIWSYISEKSASTSIADHLVDSITEHCYLLASRPYLGRNRNDEFGLQSRSFAVGEYVIVYRVQLSDALILPRRPRQARPGSAIQPLTKSRHSRSATLKVQRIRCTKGYSRHACCDEAARDSRGNPVGMQAY